MTAFKLQGIIAAPVLPMLPDASIDWASLRTYIRWIAVQKPTAIAMNMDASEGPSLEHDEQLEVLHVCKEVIAGTVPLVSGLIAGSTAGAVRWGNAALDFVAAQSHELAKLIKQAGRSRN